MSIVLTTIFRVRNWKALRQFSDRTLIGCARVAGATRYQVYRNVHDAAEALLIAEFSNHDAIAQLNNAMVQINKDAIAQRELPHRGYLPDDRVWESTECSAID